MTNPIYIIDPTLTAFGCRIILTIERKAWEAKMAKTVAKKKTAAKTVKQGTKATIRKAVLKKK